MRPGLGELVRPQRLPPAEGRGGGTAKTFSARRGGLGKLRNNESWHGKRSSPESEHVDMYRFYNVLNWFLLSFNMFYHV